MVGNDLILKYTNNDSVTLVDFFGKGSSVTTLMGNNGSKITLDQYFANKIITFMGTAGQSNNITGTKYNDIINGKELNDTLNGGAGNDTLNGNAGNDTLNGGAGNDTLNGGAGNDTLNGGVGTDKIYFQNGNNTAIFNNGDGADTIYSGTGADTIKFTGLQTVAAINSNLKVEKSGNNLILRYTNNDSITLSEFFTKGTSVTRLMANNGSVITFTQFLANKPFVFNGAANKENTINGTDYNDIIYGNNKNDKLNGGAGNDKIYGYGGNDVIHTGTGSNVVEGGVGNDTIYIDAESTGSRINYYYANKSGLQNNGNDIIYGSSNKDTLYIDTGNSLCTFNYVKNGNDLIIRIFNGRINNFQNKTPYGTITIKNYFSQNSANRLDNIIIHTDLTNDNIYQYGNNNLSLKNLTKDLSGEVYVSGNYTGTNADEIIYGSNGADNINAKGGNDKITPGKGNDIINTGSGDDIVYFSKGDGNDIIRNEDGKTTIYFLNDVGGISTSRDEQGRLVIHYGNSDTITIDYFNSPVYIRTYDGLSMTFANEEPQPQDQLSFTLKANQTKTVTFKNPFTNQTLTYTLVNLSDKTQTYDFRMLENGRLFIKSDYLKITADKGQADDIIFFGNNNKIYTGDGDDIVRLGYVIDQYSPEDEIAKDFLPQLSENNTVDTATGNDHVAVYGSDNVIDTGDGTDSLYLAYGAITADNFEDYMIEYYYTDGSQDNEIGLFRQFSMPDCRLFALLDSIQRGTSKFSLSDLVTITYKGNNTYNVLFKNYSGPNNSYDIVDLDSIFDESYNSFGDLDVFLIDYAMNKLIEQNGDYGKGSVYEAYYNTISQYLFGTDNTTFADLYLTENKTKSYFITLIDKYLKGEISNIEVCLFGEDHPELGYRTGHAYSVYDMTDSYITLVNPWNNGDKITLSLESFDNYLYSASLGIYINFVVYGEYLEYINENMYFYDNGMNIIHVGNSQDLNYEIQTVYNSADINAVISEMVSWQDVNSADVIQIAADSDQTANINLASVISDDINKYAFQV